MLAYLVLASAAVAVVLVLRRRARAKTVRAGLVAERPTFSVTPPARRLAPRSTERL